MLTSAGFVPPSKIGLCPHPNLGLLSLPSDVLRSHILRAEPALHPRALTLNDADPLPPPPADQSSPLDFCSLLLVAQTCRRLRHLAASLSPFISPLPYGRDTSKLSAPSPPATSTSSTSPPSCLLLQAARYGRVHVLRWALDSFFEYFPSIDALPPPTPDSGLSLRPDAASAPFSLRSASKQSVAMRRYLVRAAVCGGHVAILELLEQRSLWNQNQADREANHRDLTYFACLNNQRDMLRYLVDQRRLCKLGFANECYAAALGGHNELLRWLRTEARVPWPSPANACASAALGGHLSTLQYLHQQGCFPDEHTAAHAARLGHLNILQWLQQEGLLARDPLVTLKATTTGQLEVLRWLRSLPKVAGEEGDGLYPLEASCCRAAAMTGQLRMLQWLREQGCPWNTDVCARAAEGNHLNVLQWARQTGCPWDERVCVEASLAGLLPLLQWAVSQQAPLSAGCCSAAAENGHLEVLKFLRSEAVNCPWDVETCAMAAERGHLAVLQWARGHGCPWDAPRLLARTRLLGFDDIHQWVNQYTGAVPELEA